MDADVDTLLARIDRPADELQALADDIDGIPAGARVRSAFVFFVLDTWESSHSDSVGLLRELIARRGASFFGMLDYGLVTAMAAFLGARVKPDLTLPEAANFLAEDMILRHADSPIVRTLRRISDDSIRGFLVNFVEAEALIWSFRAAYYEKLDRRSGALLIGPPYSRAAVYTAPGFVRGLAQVFGREREAIEVTCPADVDDPLELRAEW